MANPTLLRPLRLALIRSPEICAACRRQAIYHNPRLQQLPREFNSSAIFRADPAPAPKIPANKEAKEVKDGKPLKSTKEEEEFVPKPLGAPIGFPQPPKAGIAATIPKKQQKLPAATWRERHTAKTQKLVDEWGKSYFRDFKHIRKYRSGKVFLANPRIFRAEVALHFPNFRGMTLRGETEADTTPVLKGKVSLVNVYSSQWGELQAKTFTGPKNEELRAFLEKNKDVCQMVDINIEENPLKYWVLSMFWRRLKWERAEEDWDKYFVVRRGVTDLIRERLGMLNSRVGYVYLVDKNYKIRWAGSGDAEGDETQYMMRGLEKLADEARGKTTGNGDAKTMTPAEKVNEELETQTVNAGAS